MSTATVTAEAAAVADGLEALAAKVRSGELRVHDSGLHIQYNPGSPGGVRAEAERLGLKVTDRPGFTRASLPVGPKVTYVLYAMKGDAS